jgi:quinol monooxygenase YgiN
VVTLINKLVVTGDPGDFEQVSEALTAYMRQQPGYIRFQLFRSLRQPTVYVELAEWESAEQHKAAVTSEGFRSRVQPLAKLATVEPDIFEVIREGRSA